MSDSEYIRMVKRLAAMNEIGLAELAHDLNDVCGLEQIELIADTLFHYVEHKVFDEENNSSEIPEYEEWRGHYDAVRLRDHKHDNDSSYK